MSNYISPINPAQREQVISRTSDCLDIASGLYKQQFDTVPVLFDLSGRAAGMFRVKDNKMIIRYNPWIFARYFQENLQETIPHEVAHYVTYVLYSSGKANRTRIRPHGREWQEVIRRLGAEPRRLAEFDLSGIPVRTYQYFPYSCGCRNHQLSSRRHNKILNQAIKYHCRECGDALIFQSSSG